MMGKGYGRKCYLVGLLGGTALCEGQCERSSCEPEIAVQHISFWQKYLAALVWGHTPN